MIRALRTLIALPLFLIAAATLVAMVWNFATAVIFQRAGDIVVAFMYLGMTTLLLLLVAVANPKAPQVTPKIKTLIIPADPHEPLTRSTIDRSLTALQEAVGGRIDAVGDGPNWTAWADEDGKAKRRPYNVRATHAMAFMAGHNIADPIVGDVVICGHTVDGQPCDLVDFVAARAEELARETGD